MSTRFPKALPLALVLSGALLGGCSVTISGDLAMTAPVLTSDYQDGSGNPIICYNRLTPMQFSFDYVGDLQYITVTLVGRDTGASRPLANSDVTSTNFTAGDGVVNFVIQVGNAPLRVKPEAIVVVPVLNPIGATKIELRGYSSTNRTRTLSSNSITVVNNCP